MITSKQINYVLAVSKTLHFKRAAELCYISPSTLSMAIADLENQLGFSIFERNNKNVIVTPMGHAVLRKARDIKLKMDDINRLGELRAMPLSTPIALGIIPTISPYLLPRVLPALKQHYPQLTLNIVEDRSSRLVEQVQTGEIDMAILALPFDIKSLSSFKFWQEDFYYITHKDNVKGQSIEIEVSDLNQSELLLLEDGHCLKEHALAACKLTHKPMYTMKVSSLATLVQLVAGNMGSTLVPQMALEQLLGSNGSLAMLHLNQPSPHREIALVARPNYPGIANIHHLTEVFSAQLHTRFGGSKGI